MKTIEIIIRGYVQGIGFRYFVLERANRTNVKGFVSNLSNGDVLIMAQGDEEQLEDFLERVKTEHSYASIESIKISNAEEEVFNEFKIKL
ncbi:MAG: acylphosphatase [bacterium (Candidatus Stahlbacteria) CG23_combo_of_CG06-09_8_20_14_all_34_7]|nr:MAG: acylphosphatase [bacterium (Candidatus Stahlbacteria) CG23_combo_of_CG06-09_8_20_14_all_34_7]